MRHSTTVMILLVVQAACLLFLGAVSGLRRDSDLSRIALETSLVRAYGLTDLCLFSEARHTRHPSQADFHSAFQDHPASLDLFPSGSLITPPAHISRMSSR